MPKKKIIKLTKEQRQDIYLVLSWYNLAWSISNKKHKEEEKRIANKASDMIEDIILNNQ